MRVKSPPRPRAESRTAQPYHVFAETQRAKRSVAYMSDKSCKLLSEHLVDKRRELVRTAPDIAADDIALRHFGAAVDGLQGPRSEEHTSELQSLMRTSYAVFCLKKTKTKH